MNHASSVMLSVICICLCIGSALAVPSDPLSFRADVKPLSEVELIAMPAINLDKVVAEDTRRASEGLPPRFAEPIAVSISSERSGTWESLESGEQLWRIRIHSKDALSLNFGFTKFFMPQGSKVYIYNPEGTMIQGPYSVSDNKAHRQLWTPIVNGDTVVIEMTVPESGLALYDLHLGYVNHGYKPFGKSGGDKSGSCNLDVICSDGDGWGIVDPWRDEIRAVAVYQLNGSWTCTGTMVNNVRQDRTPYFLTADHCGISAGNDHTMVVYWNYENSWCRQPLSSPSGQPGDGNLSQNQTGATFRSELSASDFTLVELDAMPNSAWNVHWAGWDSRNLAVSAAVGIHHPSTDEKRISFENDALTTTTYLNTSVPGDGTHWRVIDWDVGTTEGGSSGSGLFNPDHRLVGQLHGGYAACGNDSSDWYGKISYSWATNSNPGNQLKYWLDPDNTGTLYIDGTDECDPPVADFTISPNPALPGQLVTFNCTVSGGGTPPYSFAWDVTADGTDDYFTEDCTHTYSSHFNGTIRLVVTDSLGCSTTVYHALAVNAPALEYSSHTVDDSTGDNDGIADPGESIGVSIVLSNTGSATAAGVTAILSESSPYATITDNSGNWPNITAGASADSTNDFTVDIDPGAPLGTQILFTLNISATGYSSSDTFTIIVGAYPVLVIDDSSNGAASLITTTLTSVGCTVTQETAATTNSATWPTYAFVVWSSGNNNTTVTQASWRTNLESYIAAGHKLWIEGGEVGYNHRATSFGTNVLHITGWTADNAGDITITQATHPLMTTPNGLSSPMACSYSSFGDKDSLNVASTAVQVCGWSGATQASIVARDSDGNPDNGGQIVFTTFNYQVLATAHQAPLAGNIVRWLAGGAPPEPTPTPTSPCPGGTYVELIDEHFDVWSLTGWTIVNNGGDCVWRAGSAGDADSNNTGGSGEYADADSDACGTGTNVDTELHSPLFSLVNFTSAHLEFKSDMRWYSEAPNEFWRVDVTGNGGSSWTNLLDRSGQDYRGPETITLSLDSVLGSASVMVRFHYGNAAYDYWWQVDDVLVYGCESTGSTATPTPIPTNTSVPTDTPTNTPTLTPTRTPTLTPTNTPTNTSVPTDTPTNTPTLTPTHTPTLIPTNTPTHTPTLTPTNTPTNTPSQTPTPNPTNTSIPTETPIATATDTPEPGTPTATPTSLPIPTTGPTGLILVMALFSGIFWTLRRKK